MRSIVIGARYTKLKVMLLLEMIMVIVVITSCQPKLQSGINLFIFHILTL